MGGHLVGQEDQGPTGKQIRDIRLKCHLASEMVLAIPVGAASVPFFPWQELEADPEACSAGPLI